MSHLTPDERLLAIDDALDVARRAHLAACAACRAEVEALASVVARVKAVDVPEPSPLFWDHLAARVGEAIAREPVPAPPARWWAPRLAWAAAVVVTIAAVGFLTSRRAVPIDAPAVATRAPVAPSGAAAATSAPDVEADVPSPEPDEDWAFLAAMADDAALDVLAPQAGQSELSIATLSAAERSALARELEAALAAGGRTREG